MRRNRVFDAVDIVVKVEIVVNSVGGNVIPSLKMGTSDDPTQGRVILANTVISALLMKH